MIALFLLVAVALANKDEAIKKDEVPTGPALVEYLKKHKPLFEVEETAEANKRMKYLMDPKYMVVPKDEDRMRIQSDEEPPESFDARKVWPKCTSIGTIRDQSNCGSCWAVSAAETMSDRLCVQSGGKIRLELSDTDLLACCGLSCGYGCEGGYPLRAWEYIMKHGICTGGRYRQKGVCKPYAFHPCGYHPGQTYYGDCPMHMWATPKCKNFCQRGYHIPYQKDKFYGISAYSVANNEKDIRREIMKNGPVQAGYYVYEDFRLYKGGIYKHETGAYSGGHAVKIIGWGVENGTDYWIIANSWNVNWGENGYFRMIRGINDCNLEAMIYAGMMKV